jgi:hypothetical protein
MSWTLFKVNVLKSMASFQFAKDPDGFADFYANEYDKCIKRGGDMLYGVPVINGNITGMADAIKRAFKKGQDSGGENFNILQEIYPAAFDAYWLGAEMAPIPNPILKPLGWQSTPPAPGAIMNIGPNPIMLASSAALHKAEVEATKALEDKLKEQTIDITGIGRVNLFEVLQRIIKKEPIDDTIKNQPIVKSGLAIMERAKQAKKKKPSIGSQLKKSLKFPFPKLPSRKELLEKIKNQLLDVAIQQLEKEFMTADEKIPTKEELSAIAFDLIKDSIPQIPNVFFIPPTIQFSFQTNALINPFVNLAKTHLMGVGGNMMVIAQYPPPVPPAPSVLNWSGYTIIG